MLSTRFARSAGFGAEGCKQRVLARSGDGGAAWADTRWAETLPSFTPCDAGFLRLTHDPAAAGDWLAFSWPDHPTQRRLMTVGLSRDGGRTWPVRREVNAVAGYSDLVEFDDSTIGMLYDRERTTRFARFNPAWLAGEGSNR